MNTDCVANAVCCKCAFYNYSSEVNNWKCVFQPVAEFDAAKGKHYISKSQKCNFLPKTLLQ